MMPLQLELLLPEHTLALAAAAASAVAVASSLLNRRCCLQAAA
jgi:hypothetical protein